MVLIVYINWVHDNSKIFICRNLNCHVTYSSSLELFFTNFNKTRASVALTSVTRTYRFITITKNLASQKKVKFLS